MCDLMINHNNNSVIFIIQVIAAEGEQKAARALKEAAEVISSSSAALQLRYLQTVSVRVLGKAVGVFPDKVLSSVFLEKRMARFSHLLLNFEVEIFLRSSS